MTQSKQKFFKQASLSSCLLLLGCDLIGPKSYMSTEKSDEYIKVVNNSSSRKIAVTYACYDKSEFMLITANVEPGEFIAGQISDGADKIRTQDHDDVSKYLFISEIRSQSQKRFDAAFELTSNERALYDAAIERVRLEQIELERVKKVEQNKSIRKIEAKINEKELQIKEIDSRVSSEVTIYNVADKMNRGRLVDEINILKLEVNKILNSEGRWNIFEAVGLTAGSDSNTVSYRSEIEFANLTPKRVRARNELLEVDRQLKWYGNNYCDAISIRGARYID